jgi:predicted dehydrogenase
MKKLRIGFLSTAGIGRKNWKAIFNSGNAVVSAVASRNIEKSLKFIGECQREFSFPEKPHAFGSYEELISSPDVDAVYVPLPTGLRKDLVIRAAQNGKNILCEKPCAASVAELDAMLVACKKNSVQFMDGVMFMHSPRLARVRETLNDDKSVGRIRRISAAFSFYPGEDFFHNNIRTDGALEPAGCLGDLGWYSIRFALWTLNWQMPHTVTGKILSQSSATDCRTPTPTEFSGELFFDDGVSVEFYCSFLTGRQQWVHVSGQNGWLRLPDFVHPLNSYEPTFEVNEKIFTVTGEVKCPPGVDPLPQGHATAQDTRMWRNFANQIASGQLNTDWLLWALQTQKVLDACLAAGRSGKTVAL